MSERECEYCGEDHEEDAHGEALVVREGASSRTADDLSITFLDDVADTIESTGTGHNAAAVTLLRATSARLWAEAIVEGDHGCHWLPIERTELVDELNDTVNAAEGYLSDAGFFVTWNDGYWIVGAAAVDDKHVDSEPLYAERVDFDAGSIVILACKDADGAHRQVAVDHRAAQVIVDAIERTGKPVPIEAEPWQVYRAVWGEDGRP